MDQDRLEGKLDKISDDLSSLRAEHRELKVMLNGHLDEHKLSFKRLTQIYIPSFAIAFPTITFLVSWFTSRRR